MHSLTPRLLALTVFLCSAACGILPEGDPNGTEATDEGGSTGSTTGGSSTGGSSTGGTKSYTFAADLSPLLQSNCGVCHGAGASNQSSFDITTKAAVVSKASLMQSDVDGGNMPLGGSLTAAQKAIVDGWVSGGMN